VWYDSLSESAKGSKMGRSSRSAKKSFQKVRSLSGGRAGEEGQDGRGVSELDEESSDGDEGGEAREELVVMGESWSGDGARTSRMGEREGGRDSVVTSAIGARTVTERRRKGVGRVLRGAVSALFARTSTRGGAEQSGVGTEGSRITGRRGGDGRWSNRQQSHELQLATRRRGERREERSFVLMLAHWGLGSLKRERGTAGRAEENEAGGFASPLTVFIG
jgi:hypothetical protein